MDPDVLQTRVLVSHLPTRSEKPKLTNGDHYQYPRSRRLHKQ